MRVDRDVQCGLLVFGSGMIGIIFAGILKALYDRGIVIDEMITGSITITDVMGITILLWLLIGVMIAVLRR